MVLTVLHRNFLGVDEFLGRAALPLSNYDHNEKPKSRSVSTNIDQNIRYLQKNIEMFYLNSTLNFGISPVLIFQLEVYYKVDRLVTAQQKGTTA